MAKSMRGKESLVLIVSAAVLLVIVAMLYFNSRPGTSPQDELVGTESTRAPSDELLKRTDVREDSPLAKASTTAPASRIEVRTSSSDPAPTSPDVVHYSVAVHDERDDIHSQESGHVRLRLQVGSAISVEEYTIADGQIFLSRSMTDELLSLSIVDGELGGRAIRSRVQPVPPVSNGLEEKVLHAEWIPSAKLFVTEARQTADLDGLDVSVGPEMESPPSGVASPRADPQRLFHDVRSPIDLTGLLRKVQSSGACQLSVRKHGYLAGYISVDLSLGGDYRLALVPSALLRIRFVDLPLLEKPRVVVFQVVGTERHTLGMTWVSGKDELELDLPEGSYDLELQDCPSESITRTSDSAHVDLAFSRPVEVVLHGKRLGPRNEPDVPSARGNLELTILVPTEWGQIHCDMTVTYCDDTGRMTKQLPVHTSGIPEQVGVAFMTYRAGVEQALTGWYLFAIEPIHYHVATRIEVLASPTTFQITAPHVALVAFRIVNPSGVPSKHGAEILLQPLVRVIGTNPPNALIEDPSDYGLRHSTLVRWGGEVTDPLIRCPATTMIALVGGESFIAVTGGEEERRVRVELQVEPKAGQSQIDLPVTAVGGIEVIVFDSDHHRLPWIEGWTLQFSSTSFNSITSEVLKGCHSRIVYVSEPGDYRVHAAEIPRIRPPIDTTVWVNRGEIKRVVLGVR